jgi:superoxide dismutase, Fe-Mn family
MKHELPKLPYPKNALEPYISRETLNYHYGKHHKGYVDQLNELIKGTPYENNTIEEIIRTTKGPLFNNAAQAWNHEFFWNCLSPERTRPSQNLGLLVEKSFGSMSELYEVMIHSAMEHFGSGYVWLIHQNGNLRVETTHDADNPLRSGQQAILTCDLWEHAYYIDYRNEKKRYLESIVQILNWEFAENNLQGRDIHAA